MDCQPIINCQFLHKEKPPSAATDNFGILNIKVPEASPLPGTYHFVINCDRSGSMTDICRDGKTKMAHLHHTLNNMLRYFLGMPSNINVLVSLIAFDNTSFILCEGIPVIKSNMAKLEDAIKQLYPRGMTNIELAVQTAEETIDHWIKRDKKNKNATIAHIFLTDGQITSGSTDPERISSHLFQNYINIFVGYGIDHNDALLSHLSAIPNGDYYFVESFENAGMVYGEIVHGILHRILTNITIKVTKGKIYNYKNNSWNSTLTLPSIPTGTEKTYHITKDNWQKSNGYRFELTYNIPTDTDAIVVSDNITINYPTDLIDKHIEKYWYRQKTQELMFITRKYITENGNTPQETNPKEKLDIFMIDLKEYMRKNDLEHDEFMKTLCDDIYVSLQSLYSNLGNMYLFARQNSQGLQRAYNMRDLTDLTDSNEYYRPHNILRRPQSGIGYSRRSPPHRQLSYHANSSHQMSQKVEGVYASPSVSQAMRSMNPPSGPNSPSPPSTPKPQRPQSALSRCYQGTLRSDLRIQIPSSNFLWHDSTDGPHAPHGQTQRSLFPSPDISQESTNSR